MSGGTSAAAIGGTAAASAAAAASATAVTGGVVGAAAGGIFEAATAGITLAQIGTIASLGSALVGGIGAITSGNASAASSRYNAQIAEENATIAKQNATWAGEAGAEQAGQASQKTRAEVGAIKAAQAANNVDVNSGSALDVRSTAAELGQLSAINIRSNAARSAYGYQTKAASEESQSQLDTFSGEQSSLAGEVGAGSTILGGAANAGLNYSKYLQQSSPISSGF